MQRPRHGVRPGVETLDPRRLMSASQPAAPLPVPTPASTALAADSAPVELRRFADAYLSTRGEPRYDPALDTNGNGQIGQGDATPILRALAPRTPRVEPRLELALAPGEQVTGHHPSNNGGVTRLAVVTVVGRTTPNSIIFTDGPVATGRRPTGDFKFRGIALASDARGNFSYTLPLGALSHGGSLTNTAFLVHDPFGRHMERAFPIRRLP